MFNYRGSFNVIPYLPKNLEPLREIAFNLHWTWNHDAIELFRRLDTKLWEKTHHNPVSMLGQISQERLEEASQDDGFVAHLNRVYLELTIYLKETTWYQKNFKECGEERFVAYFSAEFGLTECLQIYSGGLGILAGDHLKAASDLGVPLIGMGLCYKEGYFQQYLTSDGWQQERYELTDFYNQPMNLVENEDGQPLRLELQYPGRAVHFQIWKIDVGRIPLYLLDTNLPENTPEDREITRTLYGGNTETRIQQEILLGVGGVRAMLAMGMKPNVCHMNEGHSAFLALERIRYMMQNNGLTFDEAKNIGYYSNIFTTHTPVPAGIDVFPNELVEKYFGTYYREELKLKDKEFYSLGTLDGNDDAPDFNMAHLAMNMAGYVNGVSRLHSKVSKKMWVEGFKNVPFDEIPIDYVTNGIHTHSHLANEMKELLYRYLGDKFIQDPASEKVWAKIQDIPDEELWRTHERRRERLVAFARKRFKEQIKNYGGSKDDMNSAKEILDPGALTIGFARRFATYKRATLLFRDPDRLANIICNPDRPVQFIIAGKAHPKDEAGKKLIQEVVRLSKTEPFKKKIFFVENYDMNTARYMVEGCDVWLNNPRRPMEASGTSGMKVIANGGLNFSVLDGWWDEGYENDLGWKIGNGEEYENTEYQDEVESRLIFETLEKEIIPAFYERSDDKLPRKWISMMKASMQKLGPVYNTSRMVGEYFNKFYYNSYQKRKALVKNNWKVGKSISEWKDFVRTNWDKVEFIKFSHGISKDVYRVGQNFVVDAKIDLGNLTPKDVEVQIYYGQVDQKDVPYANNYAVMEAVKGKKNGSVYEFKGEIDCQQSGNFGYTLRILPKHEMLINQFEMGLIKWA